ncbi:Tenascin-R [Folsomia candida]|uniref:Tenascin-R n=1 Tax=Folsomia candida TaxID=158441 RepID=A0A226DS87_FOLCA|nr:Tenascin-R [Folsomia candida]
MLFFWIYSLLVISTLSTVHSQGNTIPGIVCVGPKQGDRCREECTKAHPGTMGVCQNGVCICSSDPLDIKCGGDGSLIGIRCPDVSACRRRCCREGKTGGRCKWHQADKYLSGLHVEIREHDAYSSLLLKRDT